MIKNGLVLSKQYELQKLLGQGSYGQVWTALNRKTDIKVAVKLVPIKRFITFSLNKRKAIFMKGIFC